MAIYRKAAKRDAAEPAIVAALEAAGASVVRISAENVPDLLCGFRGRDYQLEVKTGKKKATAGQLNHHANWKGQPIRVVRTPEEALYVIGAIESEPYTPWVVGPERHPLVQHPNVSDAVNEHHKMSHQKFTKQQGGAYQLELLPDPRAPKPTDSMSDEEILRHTVEFGQTMNLMGIGTGFWLDSIKKEDE